jgi:MFS family permease
VPVCDRVGGNVTASENPLLEDVQKRASIISAVALGLQILPAAISTLIMVNAADLIGRKKLFILPLFGYLIYNLNFLCNWFIAGSSWWMIVEAVHEFLGGRHVITVVGVLYITDITTVENRTRRLNILGLLELFGSGVGVYLAGFILDAKNVIGSPDSENISEQTEFVYNGFTSVYVIASILTISCILPIIFFVKESRPRSQGDVTLAKILSTESMKASINTVMRDRHDGSRGIILCLCVAYFFVAVNYGGIYLSGSLWLFLQKLSWQFSEYTSYVGANAGVVLVGCTTLVPFLMAKARLQDMTFALLATLGSIINGIIIFCTPYNNHWVPYLGFPVNLLTGIVATCIKSTLTKVVEPKDVTQVLLRLLLFLLILFPFMFSATVSAFSRPSECISTKKPP